MILLKLDKVAIKTAGQAMNLSRGITCTFLEDIISTNFMNLLTKTYCTFTGTNREQNCSSYH